MKTLLWNTINDVLGGLGYELRARKPGPPPITMDGLLSRAAARGLKVGTIVDIGAAAGRWTRKALRHFPDVRFLLIEPLDERRAALEELRARHPNVEFAIAAAGEREGTAQLTVSPDLDGSGIYSGHASAAKLRDVPVTTLDAELSRRALPAPYLLKFDTHGFELPILAGAKGILPQTSAVVMEVYNFQLSAGCLRFHEMSARMESLGFRCADLADPMLRPRDQVLWQLDLLFFRNDAPFFKDATY